MIDTLTAQNRNDFSQRYRGAFGWLVKEDSARKLVHITDVQADRVIFSTSEDSGFFALSNKGVQFEFLPVTRGFIPTKKNVYLLNRHPARQFQRGISEGNTTLSVVLNRGNAIYPTLLNLEGLSQVFEHPISYKESVTKYLEQDDPVCALSLHFAIAGKNLYFLGRPAGSVEKTTITPMTLIKQELQDLINRNKWLFHFSLQ